MTSQRRTGPALVGRDAELELLRRALAESAGGGQRAVAVLGEAGIGRTRLVEELAGTASGQGRVVVWGRAGRHPGAPPFWAWRQVLRALGFPHESLSAASSATDRYEQLDVVVDLLEQRARPGGLVVVLEDVHWLDESSWWLLAELLRLRSAARTLLVLTARQPDLDRLSPHPLSGDDVSRIVLGPLPDSATAQLVRSLAGASDVDDSSLAAVVDRSAGNPFFAAELAHAASGAGNRLPVTVRGAVRERLDRLPPSAATALQAASVLGRSFSVGLVAGMTGTSPLQSVEALDDAVEAGVIVPDDQLGCYRFAHPLTADAISDGLDPPARRRTHRAAIDSIERVHAGDLDDWAAELARHAAAAFDPGDQRRAAYWTVRAADVAARTPAWEEAARLTRQALGFTAAGFTPAERGRLLVQWAVASFRSTDLVAAGAAVEQALTVGDPELAAHAVLAVEPIGAAAWDARVRRWCATALRAGDLDPDLSARLHARLAQALMYAGELAAADQMSRRAIGADRASIAALQARQLVRSGPDGVAERSGLARELLAAAGSASDLPAELSGHLWQLDGAFETGDLAAATSALRAAADTAAPLSGPIPRWLIVRGRAALRQAQGRYREALQLADDAHRLLARTGHPGADGARLGLRAAVGRHLGHEPGEAGTTAALEPFQPLVDDHDDDPSGFLLLARVVGASAHAEAGRLQEAARYLDSAGPVAGWHVPPYLHLGVWAGAVPALVGLHRRADLDIVRQRLRPYAGGFVASGAGTTFFLGPVDLHLGIAERALGQSRPAAQSLREACRLAAAAGLPGFLAEAQLELGVTLLGSSSTADHRRARDLLTSAGDGAARLGMTAVRRRVEQARAAASPLTARERNVASLVADGLTNRQIAEKLVVSERTAENHVQHILGKLGLTNRVQVAGWWREQRG